jgi:hypothetical protein
METEGCRISGDRSHQLPNSDGICYVMARCSGDSGCQQLVGLAIAGGIANSRSHCQHLLASHVIWKSINSPRSYRREYKLFLPQKALLHNVDILDKAFHMAIRTLFCWHESRRLFSDMDCPVQ